PRRAASGLKGESLIGRSLNRGPGASSQHVLPPGHRSRRRHSYAPRVAAASLAAWLCAQAPAVVWRDDSSAWPRDLRIRNTAVHFTPLCARRPKYSTARYLSAVGVPRPREG